MSEFACPECRAPSPTGARAGTPYACPACGNPVLPVARATVAHAPDADATNVVARPPWKIALLAFVVLGAAYLGAYELLTAEAKRERDRLSAKYGPALTTFADPGQPPMGTDAASLRDYREQHEKHEDRTAYESRVARIDTMFIGLLFAFAAQSVLTAILLAKTAMRAKAATKRGLNRLESKRAPRPAPRA